jgi:putative NADH-flavin reductase
VLGFPFKYSDPCICTRKGPSVRIYTRSRIDHSLIPASYLNMTTPVWFITGASGGLGEILARRALSEGHRVIGTCRDKQKSSTVIEPLQDRGMAILELDVAGTQQYIFTKMQEAISIYGHIDILVNNAGYEALGPLERFTYVLPKICSRSTFARLLILLCSQGSRHHEADEDQYLWSSIHCASGPTEHASQAEWNDCECQQLRWYSW